MSTSSTHTALETLSQVINLGDLLTVRVERAAAGGRLLSYAPDGRVMWVSGVVGLDDLVEVQVTAVKKRAIEARVMRVIERAETGRVPICPRVHECGGCPWQALSDLQQTETLERDVTKMLSQAMETPIQLAPTWIDPSREWRATARFHWNGTRLGFYGRSGVIDLDACPILTPTLNLLLKEARLNLIPSLAQGEAELKLSAGGGDSSGVLALRLFGPREDEELNALSQALSSWVEEEESLLTGATLSAHLPSLRQRAPHQRAQGGDERKQKRKDHRYKRGHRFKKGRRAPQHKRHSDQNERSSLEAASTDKTKAPIEKSWGPPLDSRTPPHPIGTFMQAHLVGNQALIEQIIRGARGAQRILELYSGSGNLSVPLALDDPQRTLLCIEADPRSIETLNTYTKMHDLNITARAERVTQLPEGDFDHIILDPPRAGASELMATLATSTAQVITYVSCHPATLARDLKHLRVAGWRLAHAQLFHLFPHSGHVEVYVRLERNPQMSEGSP
jgi:23S rRNA (uracil1939-C5)-methyltransferase